MDAQRSPVCAVPASLPFPSLTHLMLDAVPFDAPSPALGAEIVSLLVLSEMAHPILRHRQAGFYAGIIQNVMLGSKASQRVWELLFSMLA